MSAPGAAPALRLRGVRVAYGARTALQALDLEVARGEFVALTGPNGSGKSTLLRAALGLIRPDDGVVELFGTPIERLPIRARAHRVAWVPQSEGLREDVPLARYVLYGRYARQGTFGAETAGDRARAFEALADVGLQDRIADGILSLSGGERQRAVLARALAQEAPLLLLDEPTTHLDVAHQLDLLGRVRTLVRDRGLTVVAALHDLNLAARFAGRIVVLSRGRRVADGPPADVLSAELLASVWGIDAERREDPTTGQPYLLPRRLVGPRAVRSGAGPEGPVHVVGGGGSAAPILRALAEEGFALTAGALNLLDSDAETAEALGVPVALELPFAPIGPGARARNLELLERARAVVVAPFAVGPSNLTNLEDLRRFVPALPTLLLARPSIDQRDFCGGRAGPAYRALVAAGAIEVGTVAELAPALRRALAAPRPVSALARGASTGTAEG